MYDGVCKLYVLINMITYGLVKQVGPYSKNEPSSYSSTANNVTVMAPNYPYDPIGESTSIHNRSLWAARLVADSANLEDPKTSLQYAKAQQQKQNVSIVLESLFGNTFTTSSETQQQQPQGRSLSRAPLATEFLLRGLEALNYELRRQRSALENGVSSPTWSEYSGASSTSSGDSFPGVTSVTPTKPYTYSPGTPDSFPGVTSVTPTKPYTYSPGTPDSFPGVTSVTPTEPYAPYGVDSSNGSPDITWAERILSAGLAAMDIQLADQIADQDVKEEIKNDINGIWGTLGEIGSVDMEYEIARDRFDNMMNEIQTVVSTTRQVQQAVMVAQSPVSEMAPKRSLLDQSLQTAGLPPVDTGPTTPENSAEAAFDLLLNRLKRTYYAVENAQFKEFYNKEILPAHEKRDIPKLPNVPSEDPTEIAVTTSKVPSVEDLTLLRSGRVTRERKKQLTGPYDKALDKIKNVITKYGVWNPEQPLRFLQPGVWNPQQGIQYVYPDRGEKRGRDDVTYLGEKRRFVTPPQGTKRGKNLPSSQEPKRTRTNRPPPINTDVPRVQGPKVRKTNIEKTMDSFIPQRRSKRNR